MADRNINRRLNIFVNGREVENNITAIDSASRRLLNQMRRLDRGAADYDQTLARLRGDYQQLRRESDEWRESLRETPGILGRIKDALGPVATGMLAAFSVEELINSFTSGLREAFNIVVDFDQKQADLAAVMGKSRAGIAKLTAEAIKLGSSTAYSASEVTDLQTELARLGKTDKEISGMTEAVLNSATALETDLAGAAELVGGQLNSYGEGASKAAEYSDILANSVNISATSYGSLMTALPKVSSIAAEVGVPFTRLNALLGVLADKNIAAETAGTGVRNILLTSAQAGKPYEEMLKKVAMASDKTRTATDLFGKENANVAVILATSTAKINANTKALENSAGSAEKLAKEKLNSIKGATEEFGGAWEGFILGIDKGDGVFSRITTNVLRFGSAILNAITPTRRLSDELRDHQVELNRLVGQITSSNIKEEERTRLLIKLKEEYPEFNDLINVETASNEQLKETLAKVNQQYRDRLSLQRQVERVEEAKKEYEGFYKGVDDYRSQFGDKLTEMAVKYDVDFVVDYSNVEKSAKELKKKLEAIDAGDGWIFDNEVKQIDRFLYSVKELDAGVSDFSKELDKQQKKLENRKNRTGEQTEAEKELLSIRKQAAAWGLDNAMDAAKTSDVEVKAFVENYERLKVIRQEAADKGMKNADKATELEVRAYLKRWADAHQERTKEEEKAAEKRKRQLEKWALEEDKWAQEQLDAQQKAEDSRLAALSEGYDKERQLINAQYEHQIQDLQAKIATEAELEALRKKITESKALGTEFGNKAAAHYQKELDYRLAQNKQFNDTIISLERTRMLKISQLQEKYLLKDVKDKEEAQQAELNALKVKQNSELAEFTSFQKAKGVLSKYLDADELKKVRTLEDAKKQIKEVHARQEYELQEKLLLDVMAMWQTMLAQEQFTGMPFFSEEQRQEILKFLSDAEVKLSEIRAGKAEGEAASTDKQKPNWSGVDVLGFSGDQWAALFQNLEGYAEKLEAITMVAGALKNAFGAYFDFVNAQENRTLQRFESAANKRKKTLQDQLDRGYISQEVYNARVEALDADLEKKKALIAYKQAKRERAMSLANIALSTASAIMSIWAQVPKFDFGVSATALSIMVGAMGALQAATVLATPLPSKEGFKKGGYTGDGSINDIAGPVHKKEYVIPHNVLFDNDPAIPYMVNYIEAKRTGKAGYKKGGPTSEMPEVSTSSVRSMVPGGYTGEIVAVLQRATNVLERLEANGIEGFVVIDVQAAKKVKEKIREYEALANNAKG